MSKALAQIEVDQNGWRLDRYRTFRPSVNGTTEFTHFVLVNERGGDRPPDVWLRFHGSGVAELDSSGIHRLVMKSFSQSVSWVLESGSVGMIYAFVTTETTAYDGYFHDLCQDEHGGVNVDYPMGDWGYALVGGAQTERHLDELRAYGYAPGVSRVTSVGFSDGAWLSSMNALLGVASEAVAWGGWSFARFDEWKALLPTDDEGKPSVRGALLEPRRHARVTAVWPTLVTRWWRRGTQVRGMRLDVYISAGDAFYAGTSGWYPPPGVQGSMLAGIRAIAAFHELEPAPVESVTIAGIVFERRLFANAATGNAIACHVDVDRKHDHHWMVTQEPLLRETARIRRSESRR